MLRSFIVPIILLFASCSGPRPDATHQVIPPGGKTIELKEGDGFHFLTDDADDDPSLTFVRKLSESRCPKNVQCIQAGEATILVSFTPGPGGPVTFQLVTPSFKPPLDTLGYRFTLEALTPYPTKDDPIPDGPSTATIRIVPTEQ